MLTTYTIYRAHGLIERGEIDWPEKPSLDEIARFVAPIVDGPIEHVLVLDPAKVEADEVDRSDYRDMFVDELSHVRPSGPKLRNHSATAIYRANWLRAEGGDPEDLAWIAGDAVLFDRIIWS